MKQILQSFKTGEMWLAEVPAPLCKANGCWSRMPLLYSRYFLKIWGFVFRRG